MFRFPPPDPDDGFPDHPSSPPPSGHHQQTPRKVGALCVRFVIVDYGKWKHENLIICRVLYFYSTFEDKNEITNHSFSKKMTTLFDLA